MKPVRIYEVVVRHEIVPEGRDFIEMQIYYMGQPHVTRDGAGNAVLMGEEDRRTYPIQEFYETTDDIPHPMLRRDPRELPPVERTYLAIDPELERFLAIKYQAEIDNLLTIRARLQSDKDACIDRNDRLQRWVAEWWAMPWYRRVWSAFRGGK